MQTISTKYLGPTNHRGSRVKAQTSGGAYLVQAWDYGLNPDGNHDAAAKELAVQLGWCGVWVAGDHKEGRTYIRASPAVNLDRAFVRALLGVAAFMVENDQPVRQCRTVARRTGQ